MPQPPELSPDDKAYVEEKTRRMVALAAVKRIERIVLDYRSGGAPVDFAGRGLPRELPPAVREGVPPRARRVAGFAAMWKLQQLSRQYREERAAAARAARRIALFFLVLLVTAFALYLAAPERFQGLLRMFS
ncbi:MAG: hypothetical protein IT529_01440 [Burkholderiales bacterium]|nr:hypothetical protein [Burkholderiales bacterium]